MASAEIQDCLEGQNLHQQEEPFMELKDASKQASLLLLLLYFIIFESLFYLRQ